MEEYTVESIQLEGETLLLVEYAEAAYQLAVENENLRAELQAVHDAVDVGLFN